MADIYYRNNEKLKASGAQLEYTQDQVDEYIKCSQDAIYFIKKYVKITTLEDGITSFNLWPFQEELIKTMHANRFVIAKLLRQVGKTTTTVAYILWLTLFTDTQNILIAANKRQVAEDILGKYQLAYENIPLWLQQGVIEWNKGSLVLENGSKVRASSTTGAAARSGSYNVVLLDEFAHIQPNMASDFYTSVYPTISSGKNTKIFMISTPKGLNLFHTFWANAVKKKNDFVPFEVHWTDVPGRDEAWAEEQLKNIGEERFRQEFLCEFLGSSDTLISGKKLQELVDEDPLTIRNDVRIYEHPIKEVWDDDEGKMLSIEHKYVCIVDSSEGKKLDYSAFTIIDMTETPYKVVATYRSNIIAPMVYPSVIYNACKYFNDAFILVESQTVGMQIGEILHTELEYENILRCSSGNKKAQEISGGHKAGTYIGVRNSSHVKKIGCTNLKMLIETDKLIFKDFFIKEELARFVLQTNGTYGAEQGAHDDLVITLVLFAWMTTQTYFKELVNHDLRKQMKQQFINYDDQEMLPPLHVDDGIKQPMDFFDGTFWTTVTPTSQNSAYDPYMEYYRDLQSSL